MQVLLAPATAFRLLHLLSFFPSRPRIISSNGSHSYFTYRTRSQFRGSPDGCFGVLQVPVPAGISGARWGWQLAINTASPNFPPINSGTRHSPHKPMLPPW
jgi:hypothetical protein